MKPHFGVEMVYLYAIIGGTIAGFGLGLAAGVVTGSNSIAMLVAFVVSGMTTKFLLEGV